KWKVSRCIHLWGATGGVWGAICLGGQVPPRSRPDLAPTEEILSLLRGRSTLWDGDGGVAHSGGKGREEYFST
ncbi:hypothetical protein AVEN_217233-1, partial [Araneus ventricosus]